MEGWDDTAWWRIRRKIPRVFTLRGRCDASVRLTSPAYTLSTVETLRRIWQQAAGVVLYVIGHPANREQRSRALLRAIRFQARGRLLKKSTIATVGNEMTMEALLHAASTSKAVYANPPDWAEMNVWRALLSKGDVFVDVGSNAGLYSLWAADCGATPIAIEPDPHNAERTRQNLARNGITLEVHECALAAEQGTMQFTLDGDTVNHLVIHDFTPRATRNVEVRTLDGLLAGRSVRGVKVDVEGAERIVLEGAADTLREQRVDILQLEWNAQSESLLGESREPVRQLLERFDYRFFRPDPHTFELIEVNPPPVSDTDLFAISSGFALRLDN